MERDELGDELLSDSEDSSIVPSETLKDTHVIKTFRLDKLSTKSLEETEDYIKLFFNKFSELIPKYHICLEVAQKTKKLHWQGFFYVSKDVKRLDNLTRHFSAWEKHQKSFASVRDEESYKKYCNKDGHVRISNVTPEEMSLWGTWTYRTDKEVKDDRKAKFLKEYLQFCRELSDDYKQLTSREWLAVQMIQYYGAHSMRAEQLPWLRSVLFWAQCKFWHEFKDEDMDAYYKRKVKEDMVQKLLEF